MRKQFAIIGLDDFGMRMLDELSLADCEILVIDKRADRIDLVKDRVTTPVITDAMNEEMICRIVNKNIDAAIVDMGNSMEASLLVCHYLKKIGVQSIIARAETVQQGEILETVGATRVVFPSTEAAQKIAPGLLSSQVVNFIPLAGDLVFAEIKMPSRFFGKNFIEIDFRRKVGMTVVAVKENEETQEFSGFAPETIITKEAIYLVVTSEEILFNFSGGDLAGLYKGNVKRK